MDSKDEYGMPITDDKNKSGYRILVNIPIDPIDPEDYVFELVYYQPSRMSISGNLLPPSIHRIGCTVSERVENFQKKIDFLQKALDEALTCKILQKKQQFIEINSE